MLAVLESPQVVGLPASSVAVAISLSKPLPGFWFLSITETSGVFELMVTVEPSELVIR